MRGAIGLAALLIVLGIFMPRVLADVENFLHSFFSVATETVDRLPASGFLPVNR